MAEKDYVRHYSLQIPVRSPRAVRAPRTNSKTARRSPDLLLEGRLSMPFDSRGIVLFVHGSGSNRHSPRNQKVASHLNEAQHATLLFDLLTVQEQESERHSHHLRFDIGLLASRLLQVLAWSAEATGGLDLGLFGSSTGAAAALAAAAYEPGLVKAVVSRGGRPDLAGKLLSRVQTPTLFLVGSKDEEVRGLNEQAIIQMKAPTRLEIVPGAGHLFEEPGAQEQVAQITSSWFGHFLEAPKRPEENFLPLH